MSDRLSDDESILPTLPGSICLAANSADVNERPHLPLSADAVGLLASPTVLT
ncbi:hypothetical protein ACRPHS_16285 [Pantoea allii]|uniref:hypothetical protein n=1 Tax=Pantoea allii TaxID=574096 RepID=UPI001560E14C|nr:hypothetical protein [Pantoea allii]NQS85662.1 hypothetical protein [Pantoea allii]